MRSGPTGGFPRPGGRREQERQGQGRAPSATTDRGREDFTVRKSTWLKIDLKRAIVDRETTRCCLVGLGELIGSDWVRADDWVILLTFLGTFRILPVVVYGVLA